MCFLCNLIEINEALGDDVTAVFSDLKPSSSSYKHLNSFYFFSHAATLTCGSHAVSVIWIINKGFCPQPTAAVLNTKLQKALNLWLITRSCMCVIQTINCLSSRGDAAQGPVHSAFHHLCRLKECISLSLSLFIYLFLKRCFFPTVFCIEQSKKTIQAITLVLYSFILALFFKLSYYRVTVPALRLMMSWTLSVLLKILTVFTAQILAWRSISGSWLFGGKIIQTKKSYINN